MSTEVIGVPLSNQPIQSRNGHSTATLAELGARAGAMGLEASTVNRLVASLQETAHGAALDTLDKALGVVQDIVDARLNTLLQAVRELHDIPSSVGLRDWFNGRIGVPMVAKGQVEALIMQQMGVKGRR